MFRWVNGLGLPENKVEVLGRVLGETLGNGVEELLIRYLTWQDTTDCGVLWRISIIPKAEREGGSALISYIHASRSQSWETP